MGTLSDERLREIAAGVEPRRDYQIETMRRIAAEAHDSALEEVLRKVVPLAVHVEAGIPGDPEKIASAARCQEFARAFSQEFAEMVQALKENRPC